MSFLLDALGKADDDRRRAEIPELRNYNQRSRSSMQRVLLGFTLVGLTLLSFALGYLLRPYLETTLFDRQSPKAVSAPVQHEKQTPLVPASAQVPLAENAQQDEMAHGLELEVISYSDTPAVRFAMINGVVVYEGDVLGTGERLLTIEPNAVVLEQAGRSIRISM